MLSGLNPAIAFLAGLASFVSPCVLPLVPAYLAYLGASGPPRSWGGVTPSDGGVAVQQQRSSIAVAGVGFVAGLSLVFILFFYVFALAFAPEGTRALGRFVSSHRRAIDLASAGVLLVMGLLLLTNRLTWLSAGLTQLIPSWPSPTF